jgi:hypothetical protein
MVLLDMSFWWVLSLALLILIICLLTAWNNVIISKEFGDDHCAFVWSFNGNKMSCVLKPFDDSVRNLGLKPAHN